MSARYKQRARSAIPGNLVICTTCGADEIAGEVGRCAMKRPTSPWPDCCRPGKADDVAVVGQKLCGSAALDLRVGDNVATGGDVGLAVVRMSSDNVCRYLAA